MFSKHFTDSIKALVKGDNLRKYIGFMKINNHEDGGRADWYLNFSKAFDNVFHNYLSVVNVSLCNWVKGRLEKNKCEALNHQGNFWKMELFEVFALFSHIFLINMNDLSKGIKYLVSKFDNY